MKRMLMVAMTLFVAVVTVCAAPPKNDDNALWKDAKKLAKADVKAGWIMDGASTVEKAYYFHMQKKRDEGLYEITGNVIGNTSAQTVNQGQQWAATNAAISYAKQAGGNIRGRVVTLLSAGIADGSPSVDKVIEAYENNVQKEIRGELIKSFGMYRETGKGKIEYKAVYLISEDDATKARIRAYENMKKELMLLKEADAISEFVREGFVPKSE